MNFLDPDQWNDLATLEKEYDDLTEELVKSLHERLRPYFLRRVKAEVLKLPPKVHSFQEVPLWPTENRLYPTLPERGHCPGVPHSFTKRAVQVRPQYGHITNVFSLPRS